MTEHPACHLVIARLPVRGTRGRAADRHAAHREELLDRLLTALNLTGEWAVAAIKNPDGLAHVHLAFERQTDADRFAATVKAKPSARYPGWSGQREFPLNATTEASIGAALATSGEMDER